MYTYIRVLASLPDALVVVRLGDPAGDAADEALPIRLGGQGRGHKVHDPP